jgi:hypothetical protein
MMEFFRWIEQTGFSVWIRESGSIWAYPLVLTLHTCGMGVLVGFNWAVDLRLLGIAPKIPVLSMERFFPVMWVGFWVNTATGVVLLVADASTKMTSWVFAVKMVFIVVAMIVLQKIRNNVFLKPRPDLAAVTATGKHLAILSIAAWILSITAGRLMAYLGPVSGLK